MEKELAEVAAEIQADVRNALSPMFFEIQEIKLLLQDIKDELDTVLELE